MKKRVIAFDFDGTIADSMNLEHRSMLYAIHLTGHNEITDDNLEDHFGPTESGIIRKICGEEAFAKVFPPFLKKYEELQYEEMKPIPGIKELLEKLSKRSCFTLVLVTGRSRETMEISLDYLGIRSFFQKTYWGSEEGINKDQNLEKVTKDFSVSKDEILYIGDTLADIQTMKKVGIDLISVGYCHNKKDQQILKENNPDYLIEMLLEEPKNGTVLMKHLEELSERMTDRLLPLQREIMEREGTLELQVSNYLKYVQESTNAWKRAEEMLLDEIIYS